MAGCAIPKCTNSTRKGSRMYRLPADPARRAKWINSVKKMKGVVEWSPGSAAQFCQDHFEHSAFVVRHGRKRLAKTAVPTLFGLKSTPKQDKFFNLRGIRLKPIVEEPPNSTQHDHNYHKNSEEDELENDGKQQSVKDKKKVENPGPVPLIVKSEQEEVDLPFVSEEQIEMVHDHHILTCDCSLVRQESSLALLREKKRSSNLRKKLGQALKTIKKMNNPKLKKKPKYTLEEIRKAWRIKTSCSKAGYLTLIKEGYNLPSIPTLYRMEDKAKLESGSGNGDEKEKEGLAEEDPSLAEDPTVADDGNETESHTCQFRCFECLDPPSTFDSKSLLENHIRDAHNLDVATYVKKDDHCSSSQAVLTCSVSNCSSNPASEVSNKVSEDKSSLFTWVDVSEKCLDSNVDTLQESKVNVEEYPYTWN